MDRLFTSNAAIAIRTAHTLAKSWGHTSVGSEHLLLGLLSRKNSVAANILERNGIEFESFCELVKKNYGTGDASSVDLLDMTPATKNILANTQNEARKLSKNFIGTEHILMAIIAQQDCEAVRLLKQAGVDTEKIYSALESLSLEFDSGGQSSSFQESKKTPSAKSAGGKTPTLDKYGNDLTKKAKEGLLDPVIGREAEMERVVQILSRRTKNNPCLIGEPGVGKTAVAEGLALKIASGYVPETIRDKRVVTLDLSSMIAGAKYRGEFEERIKTVMEEVKSAKDVILFIDEIHTLVGAGAAEGAIDAANILKPALSRGEIQVIGATTINEYRKYIEKDAALERRFQSVNVGEPSEEEAIQILSGLRPKYEAHHKVKITDEALESAVKLSVRYIADRFLPDKAIDLIDEAASKKRILSLTAPNEILEIKEELSRLEKEKKEAIKNQEFESAASIRNREAELSQLLEEKSNKWKNEKESDFPEICENDICEIITAWTNIPVAKLASEEAQKLLDLDKILKERVIGQDEAASTVARAIRRGRTGLKDPKRPQGSFIFCGPTGVGKTELSKALAEAVFGDENAIIRIDMSEYMEKHSVSKLIGSPPGYVGYDEAGQLTEKIRRHPYSVVLFDEIEKAHPDVFNILLQLLEDGHLTDSHGRRVDFKNTVIIMTSNLGSGSFAKNNSSLGFVESSKKEENDNAKASVNEALKRTFRPEFLNRIDEIVVFNKLSDEDICKIARLMLGDITKRISDKNIEITFDDDVVEFLAKEGFDALYGARPLRRAIQRTVEDGLAVLMLEGKIDKNDKIRAVMKDGKISYEKENAENTGEN